MIFIPVSNFGDQPLFEFKFSWLLIETYSYMVVCGGPLVVKLKFFVHLLAKLKIPKRHFEINWPSELESIRNARRVWIMCCEGCCERLKGWFIKCFFGHNNCILIETDQKRMLLRNDCFWPFFCCMCVHFHITEVILICSTGANSNWIKNYGLKCSLRPWATLANSQKDSKWQMAIL